jgi:hypothetical protein
MIFESYMILRSCRKLNVLYISFANVAAIKSEQKVKGLTNDTRVSTNYGKLSRDICGPKQPELLQNLGVLDNKCGG